MCDMQVLPHDVLSCVHFTCCLVHIFVFVHWGHSTHSQSELWQWADFTPGNNEWRVLLSMFVRRGTRGRRVLPCYCLCVCVCVCVRAHCMHLCLGNNCLYNPARYLISAPLQLITWHRRRGGQALKQQLAKCECTTSWCSTTEALGAADSAEVYGAAVTFNSLFTLTKYPTPEIQSSPEHNKSKR